MHRTTAPLNVSDLRAEQRLEFFRDRQDIIRYQALRSSPDLGYFCVLHVANRMCRDLVNVLREALVRPVSFIWRGDLPAIGN
jgi:hypothetical protein